MVGESTVPIERELVVGESTVPIERERAWLGRALSL